VQSSCQWAFGNSYAATFLSLAWAYYQTGDANAQAYVKTLNYQLDVIGGVIVQTQQADGLTWAKPDYQIKYLMDNCEAYRGLSDLASLYQVAFNNPTKSSYYSTHAAQMLQGIQNDLWNAGQNDYYTYISTIQSQYVSQGFPWPWYCAEAGWFLSTNSYMLGNRPL